MEPTLDEVREELAQIHSELLDLPGNAYARRAELRSRQNTLRGLSAELADGRHLHDPSVLKGAFERLSQVRDQLLSRHLAHESTAVGFAGVQTDFTSAVNRAIDEGAGLDEIEARLEEILVQLRSGR